MSPAALPLHALAFVFTDEKVPAWPGALRGSCTRLRPPRGQAGWTWRCPAVRARWPSAQPSTCDRSCQACLGCSPAPRPRAPGATQAPREVERPPRPEDHAQHTAASCLQHGHSLSPNRWPCRTAGVPGLQPLPGVVGALRWAPADVLQLHRWRATSTRSPSTLRLKLRKGNECRAADSHMCGYSDVNIHSA